MNVTTADSTNKILKNYFLSNVKYLRINSTIKSYDPLEGKYHYAKTLEVKLQIIYLKVGWHDRLQ